MTTMDDDWSGVAYAQNNRGGDTLAAHLQANGILPPGHVIVNVQILLRATVTPAGVKAPYLTVTMFDATGCRDAAAAFRQAVADGQRHFPIKHVQVNDAMIEVFSDLMLDLTPRGFDAHPEPLSTMVYKA
ncbi:hypothetical protein R77560_04801 [Ralstonia thomasii]|uniref:Uncharacterized protein n=1 Tax=Ralstonia thomasii TaxID=3058596 RepID=A0AAD2BTE8_9RALS|nr:hypothetical protein [Ralstonia sp. LMG 18095]CAJ0808846.1 hypothetical protein R77560_04801 [Ralstonia sp. LMG 18095]